MDFDSCGGVIPPEVYKQVCPSRQHIPSSISSASVCRGALCALWLNTGKYAIFLRHWRACAVERMQARVPRFCAAM